MSHPAQKEMNPRGAGCPHPAQKEMNPRGAGCPHPAQKKTLARYQSSITMIKKVVKKYSLHNFSEVKENLTYWLSRPPEERIEAVEILRKQYYGDTGRLQRTVRVIKRSSDGSNE